MGEEKVRKIQYKCSKCGSEDELKWWLDDHNLPPAVVNCWNCHAGYGRDQQDMMQNSIGMFALSTPALVTH